MKKLLSFLLVLVVAFSFAACNRVESDKIGTVTIVVHSDSDVEYSVGISNLEEPYSAFNAIEYLNKEKGVALEYSNSEYGAFITQLDTLKPEGKEYISFYTSVESDFGVGEWATERTYKDTKLVLSAKGVSSASLKDGAILYFEIEVSTW